MNDPNQGVWTPEALVGHVLADRYQVIQMLGEGGMGSVYLGEHTTLRKKVAIKVLHYELCRDQTQVDRFLQEARAASMIGHENIVDIVDFGPVPGGSVFFAMEYLEGEDISDLLRREGRIPWARARLLMLQIVRALQAAHDKGIIHRDLKPANCFLVKKSDGRDFVKLLDFGIAKVTDPESGDKGLTRTGAVFGTAKYMAPEQACGEPADNRTDIYAAAICLYEFLTGQVPYDGDNFMRVLSRHLTEPLTPPTTMAPDAGITPTVEAVIVKALSKQREDRYQSMGEFAEALMAVGPDGNLAGQAYQGPPQVGQNQFQANEGGPGGTMWLGQGGGATGGSPSQPPEGRGGTMLLDPNDAPPDLEYGTVKLSGPDQFQGAPIADRSGATFHVDPAAGPTGGGPGKSPITTRPPPAGYETRPPAQQAPSTHAPAGDYTMFATEKRSPVRFIAMLLVGAVIAIGGGALVAWLFLGGPDEEEPKADDDVKVAKADAKKDKEPTKEEEPPTKEDGDEGLEIPDDPPPDDPPPDDPPPDDPPPDDPPPDDPPPDVKSDKPKKNPGNNTRRNGGGNSGSGNKGKVKDRLSPSDVSKGFQRAAGKARKCIPFAGIKIKVRADINANGSVVGAKALSQPGSTISNCVVAAVKSKARFAKTKMSLDSKTWTFKH